MFFKSIVSPCCTKQFYLLLSPLFLQSKMKILEIKCVWHLKLDSNIPLDTRQLHLFLLCSHTKKNLIHTSMCVCTKCVIRDPNTINRESPGCLLRSAISFHSFETLQSNYHILQIWSCLGCRIVYIWEVHFGCYNLYLWGCWLAGRSKQNQWEQCGRDMTVILL